MIPHLFEVSSVSFKAPEDFSAASFEYVAVEVAGEEETTFLAGCFYKSRDIMSIDMVRTPIATLTAQKGSITDPFTGYEAS